MDLNKQIKPTILVCGKTGVGKTSLIQAITHPGTVPESAISDSKPCTKDFEVYKTEIANFVDAEGLEPGSKTIEEYAQFVLHEVNNRIDSGKPEKVITSIWYCIDAPGARVQEGDKKFIRKIGEQRVKIIVTKSELLRPKQVKEFNEALLSLTKPERIIFVSSHRKDGLNTLTESVQADAVLAGVLAQAQVEAWKRKWDEYYRKLRREWEEKIENEADSIIRWGAGRAAAIAIAPIPLADVGPLMINETYMIYRLGSLYGFGVGKNILSILTGVAGASLAGKILASFLPGLKIPIAAGVTYGVGKATKAYFKSGMKLSQKELEDVVKKAKKEAKKTNWEANQVKEED